MQAGHHTDLKQKTAANTAKIILPAVLSIILFTAAYFLILVPSFEQNLIEQKKHMVRELVHSVCSLLAHYRERVESGELTAAEAQLRAQRRIGQMRYGSRMKNYFWIQNMQPVLVMHPYRPDLVGKDLSTLPEIEGRQFITEAVKTVRAGGAGFIRYRWQFKDDPDIIMPKMSYVSLFEPWGWIVGSGIYLDDVRAEIAGITRIITLISLCILIILCALSGYLIAQSMFSDRRRREAEQALAASEHKYRELVQNANSIILRLDEEGRVMFINQFAQSFFGFTEADIVGKPVVGTIVPPTDSAGSDLKAFIADLARAPEKYRTHINENMTKDGRRAWVAWTNRAVYARDGRLNQLLCIGNDITDRLQAEKALEENLHFQQVLLDSIPVPVFYKAADGRYIGCNAAYEQFTGLSRDTIIGSTLADIAPRRTATRQPDIQAFIELNRGKDALLMAAGGDISYESSLTAQDGTVQHLLLTKAAFTDRQGAAGGVIGVIFDITERKKAQLDLKERETFLQSIFDGVEVLIFVVDVAEDGDFRYARINSTAQRTLGLAAEDFIGHSPEHVCRLMGADDDRNPRTNYRRCMEAGTGIGYEECALIRGEERWFLTRLTPLHDGSGRTYRIIGTSMDITAQKTAEIALHRSEQRIAGVLAAITDMLVVVDITGAIVWANTTAHKTLGPDIIGRKCYMVYGKDEPFCSTCPARRCFQDSGVHETKTEIAALDGQTMKVWITASVAEYDESGRPRLVNEVLRDVTEWDMVQKESMRAAHLASIGELAAGVAHEINNPLNGIINYAQILADDLEAAQGDTEIPLEIIAEGRRIATIVKNLLTFARETGDAPAPADVKSIFDRALMLFSKQYQKSGIIIEASLPDSLPQVHAQPQQIQQVFINILSNARYALNKKFPGPHDQKKLAVTAGAIEHDGRSFVRITFRDNGIGIPGSAMEKICNPFFSTKPPGEGTGLGLSISHNIIKNHDGRLLFESTPDQYTAVIVELPTAGAGEDD